MCLAKPQTLPLLPAAAAQRGSAASSPFRQPEADRGAGRGRYPRGVSFDLAQVNVSRLLAPLESPQLAPFMAALDEINAAGDVAPGFLWRLQTEDGNATA